MKLETPLIALLIGTLMFTGIFTVFIGLAQKNNVSYDLSDYNTGGENKNVTLDAAFADINKTKAEMDTITATFYNQTVLETAGGGLFGFFRVTWQIGRLIGNNLKLYKNMTNSMAEIIHIPPVFVTVGLSILFVVFAISVLMLLMGRIYA